MWMCPDTFNISVKAPKIPEQIKKIEGFDAAYNREGQAKMAEATKLVHAGWQAIAATDTNEYRDTLQQGVETIGQGQSIIGRVSTNRMSPQGFPIPVALESSTRYHYRRHRFSGRQTAGMIASMLKRLAPRIQNIFTKFQIDLTKRMKV
jgi:hypothetical protein